MLVGRRIRPRRRGNSHAWNRANTPSPHHKNARNWTLRADIIISTRPVRLTHGANCNFAGPGRHLARRTQYTLFICCHTAMPAMNKISSPDAAPSMRTYGVTLFIRS
jgi:hypothetical protein